MKNLFFATALMIFSNCVFSQKEKLTRVVAGFPVNYEEDSVGHYVLPDVLTLSNGQKVNDAKTWTEKRRPEIVKMFENYQDENPVPGDEGIPTIKNFSFSGIHVNDVPVLVDGSAIHPNKPLQGFALTDVTGTCKKGIILANIKNAKLKNIKVTGYDGPLLSVYDVSGSGMDGAAKLDAPKISEPIAAPVDKYKLH